MATDPLSIARRLYRQGRRRRTSREESGFHSALRFDPGAPELVLSPHFDDAVLDVWSVLSGPGDVRVVNIFAGVPEAGRITVWDATTGAGDSSARVAERIAEDAQALALASREPINLGFLDAQYRKPPPPALAAIDAAVTAAVPAVSRVYAPAGIGSHTDHVLARRYGRMLLRAGVPVTLYAELPYCVLHGWPSWVDGREPDPHRDIDPFWMSFLEEVPELPPLREASVLRLDPPAASGKLAAMRCYRTQYACLSYGARGLLDDPEIHGYEVRWELGGSRTGTEVRGS
ncbi:MAG TPA: hypothetical protein VHT27_04370 [Solirubrobacteraceae bacterium]|jgi:LmbE family N-acetylglucosaminyl deacetylase|nr:hypothetical protein [Solirubrobacteraceae bacterium]